MQQRAPREGHIVAGQAQRAVGQQRRRVCREGAQRSVRHREQHERAALRHSAHGCRQPLCQLSAVRVQGVGRASVQGDVRFTESLEKMGGAVTLGENWIEATANASAAWGCAVI